MNPFFVELQNQVIETYDMSQRVSVVCDDIRNQESLIREADVGSHWFILVNTLK